MSRRLVMGLLAGTILVAVFLFAVFFSLRHLPPGSVRPHAKPALARPAKATPEATNLPATSKLPVITSSDGASGAAGTSAYSKNYRSIKVESEPSEASSVLEPKSSKITNDVLGGGQNNLTSGLQDALSNISSVFN